MRLIPPRSLTARFAMLFAVFSTALLLLVGVMLERAVEAHFDELDEHDLSAKLVVVGNLLVNTDTAEAFETLSQRLDATLLGHETAAVLIRNDKERPIYVMRPEKIPLAQLSGMPLPEGITNWEQGGRQYLGREAGFTMPLPEPVTVRVLVTLDITHHTKFLTQVRKQLWITIAIVAALAAALGWFAAHKGLAPLRRVTVTARRLSAERLGERLSVQDAPAEMLKLVEAFNGMLDRLEAAFRRLNDYSADIAHELRTPISNLMTETEVALSRARTADEYRETLHSNLEEFERLARMISDMLFLAKADNGRLPRPGESVALDREARALVEFYEALAEERGVTFRLQGAGTVLGDRLMLQRALSNLISNALTHTPSGGVIAIGISREGDEVLLTVSNPGETIPAVHLPYIFDRFHRVDAARTRHTSGAGLGLSITRSIVEAHGGRVSVSSANSRTAFTLHFPGTETG